MYPEVENVLVESIFWVVMLRFSYPKHRLVLIVVITSTQHVPRSRKCLSRVHFLGCDAKISLSQAQTSANL